ncbi:putative C-mannosyltransferase DPY19L3 [Arapaima gigas]
MQKPCSLELSAAYHFGTIYESLQSSRVGCGRRWKPWIVDAGSLDLGASDLRTAASRRRVAMGGGANYVVLQDSICHERRRRLRDLLDAADGHVGVSWSWASDRQRASGTRGRLREPPPRAPSAHKMRSPVSQQHFKEGRR